MEKRIKHQKINIIALVVINTIFLVGGLLFGLIGNIMPAIIEIIIVYSLLAVMWYFCKRGSIISRYN